MVKIALVLRNKITKGEIFWYLYPRRVKFRRYFNRKFDVYNERITDLHFLAYTVYDLPSLFFAALTRVIMRWKGSCLGMKR